MLLLSHNIKLGNVCYQVHTYHDFQRGIWAKGKDIATLVGYENTSQTIRINVSEENQKTWKKLLHGVIIDVDAATFRPTTIFINECGMFQLIFKSKWLSEGVHKHKPIKNIIAIRNVPDDPETGYIFEVDLHYPKELNV